MALKFFDPDREEEDDQARRCNANPHLLTVTEYDEGDDRDYWSLKCTTCKKEFLVRETPDLSFCPYCSDKSLLEGLTRYGRNADGQWLMTVEDTDEYGFWRASIPMIGRLDAEYSATLRTSNE